MKKTAVDINELRSRVENCSLWRCLGQVTGVQELCIRAELPKARVGMRVAVQSPGRSDLVAEVAECHGLEVKLLPLMSQSGIGPGDHVLPLIADPTIPCGQELLGRIIDPLGQPIDNGPSLHSLERYLLERPAPHPLSRPKIDTQLTTGIRAIDSCLSLGLGQRIGLFAGPGLGKSSLLAAFACRAKCDVAVICLVGERGREVKEFIDKSLGKTGLSRSVVVLATTDAPPLLRVLALTAATAIAEWFRDQGKNVLLLVDSLTRAVRARRDMALALNEAPARGGFPASSFAFLPSLLERTGRNSRGSITAVYTVLTQEGAEDPIAEEACSLLDGHIVLSPKLAGRGHWPAIDITRSISRVMEAVVQRAHVEAARKLCRLLCAYEEHEDLILMGAYSQGSSPDTDLAIKRKSSIEAFLKQGNDFTPLDVMRSTLNNLVQGVHEL